MNRENILLSCLRGMIEFEDRFDMVEPQHAAWICERLAWHKILPLAAALSNSRKPKCTHLESVFQQVLLNNAIREKHYEKQVRVVFQMLKEASIDFIPYKGPFWGQQIYPDYSWRHIGDIDLMMNLDDARKFSAILQVAGYVPDIVGASVDEDFRSRGELTLFNNPSQKNEFPVQLHWDPLPSPRFLKRKFMSADLFKAGVVQAAWKGIDFRMPRPEIQFFYHILHATCQHQFLRFAHLLTPIHLLMKCPGLDWDYFQELVTSREAHTPIYYGLKFMSEFHPLPGRAQKIMSSAKPRLKSRLAAAFLHPNAMICATRKHGRYRRKLFRVAINW